MIGNLLPLRADSGEVQQQQVEDVRGLQLHLASSRQTVGGQFKWVRGLESQVSISA